jgi:hypothetical protein
MSTSTDDLGGEIPRDTAVEVTPFLKDMTHNTLFGVDQDLRPVQSTAQEGEALVGVDGAPSYVRPGNANVLTPDTADQAVHPSQRGVGAIEEVAADAADPGTEATTAEAPTTPSLPTAFLEQRKTLEDPSTQE